MAAPSTPSPTLPGDIVADIAAVSRISAVPTILRVVSEVTGLRLALVARVTQDSWTACAVLDRMNFGLHVGGQLEVATTLCSEVRDSHEPIIIEHASREPAYCDHRTPKMYGLESYIAVPIFRGGQYFGNICALDSRPTTLRDDKTLGMMNLFAELIAAQLAAEDQAERDREALQRERETAHLREEFIAVLGHDLRNPLFAIMAGSSFLMGLEDARQHRPVLERIRNGGERMARLVEDILDFARGRLGGGMPLTRETVDVRALVHQVVGEISGAHPQHELRVDASRASPASLDRSRAAQMLSNLVANAVQHGDPDAPVDVHAETMGGDLVFTISNQGPRIPAETREWLFHPFSRVAGPASRTGLGLGLYIASEVAKAHGGSIAAESRDDGLTVFTVRMPHGTEAAR